MRKIFNNRSNSDFIVGDTIHDYEEIDVKSELAAHTLAHFTEKLEWQLRQRKCADENSSTVRLILRQNETLKRWSRDYFRREIFTS